MAFVIRTRCSCGVAPSGQIARVLWRNRRYRYGVIAQFSPGRTPTVVIRNPHGTPVDCGAATPRIVGDKIKVVVPARCLHSPDWVRWSGYMRVIFHGDLDNDAKFEGYFDKFRSDSDAALNKRTFEFSRRVYRAS